jgi:meso-butanediol dehydrogenase/(S,S)-butanediol dehydrogenase/diacetyl reductase
MVATSSGPQAEQHVDGRRLAGRVAVVTGAGRGIGRAIARRLAADGAAVAVADVDVASAESVAGEITGEGGAALGLAVDVTDAEQVGTLVARVVERFGRVDVMVANAGILQVKPLVDLTVEDWERTMAVNVRGVFLCTQAAARQMIAQRGDRPTGPAGPPGTRTSGSIVCTASIAAKMGSPYQSHYQASKGAVVSFVRSAAWELAPYDVTVNAVCPGMVDTSMWDIIDRERGRLLGKQPGKLKTEMAGRIPLGRLEQPEDVTGLVAFLASDDARYITGQAYNVCGGVVMW